MSAFSPTDGFCELKPGDCGSLFMTDGAGSAAFASLGYIVPCGEGVAAAAIAFREEDQVNTARSLGMRSVGYSQSCMVKQEGLRLLISSADGRLLSAAPPAMSAVPPSDLKLSSTQVSLPSSTPSAAAPSTSASLSSSSASCRFHRCVSVCAKAFSAGS